MLIMLFVSPWLGANISVTRSETCLRKKRSPLLRIIRTLFSNGPCFVVLMTLAAVPLVSLAVHTVGNMNLPPMTVWAAYAGVLGLSSLTWALLALVLSDRKTTGGRVAGIVVSYVIAFLFAVVPLIVQSIAESRVQQEIAPWIQYSSLLSPFSATIHIADPYTTQERLRAVMSISSSMSRPILLTSSFYLLTAVLLALSLLARRQRQKP
jgi:hypothetical protein